MAINPGSGENTSSSHIDRFPLELELTDEQIGSLEKYVADQRLRLKVGLEMVILLARFKEDAELEGKLVQLVKDIVNDDKTQPVLKEYLDSEHDIDFDFPFEFSFGDTEGREMPGDAFMQAFNVRTNKALIQGYGHNEFERGDPNPTDATYKNTFLFVVDYSQPRQTVEVTYITDPEAVEAETSRLLEGLEQPGTDYPEPLSFF